MAFGQKLIYLVIAPLLVGYITNLFFILHEEKTIFSEVLKTTNYFPSENDNSFAYRFEIMNFETNGKEITREFEIPLLCKQKKANIDDEDSFEWEGKNVFIVEGDLLSSHLSHMTEREDLISSFPDAITPKEGEPVFCYYSRFSKGFNTVEIKRKDREGKKLTKKEQATENFNKEYVEVLEAIVSMLAERSKNPISLIGYGFGANFINQFVGEEREEIKDAYLFKPLDFEEEEKMEEYKKVSHYGLLFSIVGIFRPLNTVDKLMYLTKIHYPTKKMFEFSGIDATKFLHLHHKFMARQSHWEAVKNEFETFKNQGLLNKEALIVKNVA